MAHQYNLPRLLDFGNERETLHVHYYFQLKFNKKKEENYCLSFCNMKKKARKGKKRFLPQKNNIFLLPVYIQLERS